MAKKASGWRDATPASRAETKRLTAMNEQELFHELGRLYHSLALGLRAMDKAKLNCRVYKTSPRPFMAAH